MIQREFPIDTGGQGMSSPGQSPKLRGGDPRPKSKGSRLNPRLAVTCLALLASVAAGNVSRPSLGRQVEIGPLELSNSSCVRGSLDNCDGIHSSGGAIYFYPPRGGRFADRPPLTAMAGGKAKRDTRYSIDQPSPLACGPERDMCNNGTAAERAVELGVLFISPNNSTSWVAAPFLVGDKGGWYHMHIKEYEDTYPREAECYTLCSPVIGLVDQERPVGYAQTLSRMRWYTPSALPNFNVTDAMWMFAGEGDMGQVPYLFDALVQQQQIRYCGATSPVFCHLL